MEEKKMDDMLKEYFSESRRIPERGPDCPSVDILGKYVSGALEADELYQVGSHIKSCNLCKELTEGALLYSAYEKQIKIGAVSDKVKNKAKSLNPLYKTKRNKMMNRLKTNIWLALSLGSLAASFFAPRYFLQFLTLAVIFGLKWVFNRESTRTLIMIYNAWKRHDKSSEKELEEIFKNRL
jgi:hypothetical protein